MTTPPVAKKIWYNGKLINWEDANIHVMSHVIHYASALFEGIRCYSTRKGPAIFRVREHIQRLRDSCHIYRMDPTYSVDDWSRLVSRLLRSMSSVNATCDPWFFVVMAASASIPFQTLSRLISQAGSGASISDRKRSTRALTCALQAGLE